MSYSSRFWLYAPISAFLLLAAAAMVHWWFLAGAFEKKLAALKDRQAVPGIRLSWGDEAVPGIRLNWDSVAVSGFPFRLDANFTNFRVAGNAPHGAFFWQTSKFALHTLTYGRPQMVYEAAGKQRIIWNETSRSGVSADFLPASLHASSLVDERGLRRFDLDGQNFASQEFGLYGKTAFTIGRFQFHMRRDPDGKSLDLMLQADNWGRRKQVQVYATLTNAGAFNALLKGEASWPDAAAAWRAQGGKTKLSQVIAPGLDPETLLSPLY
jgi:hypothetical protein